MSTPVPPSDEPTATPEAPKRERLALPVTAIWSRCIGPNIETWVEIDREWYRCIVETVAENGRRWRRPHFRGVPDMSERNAAIRKRVAAGERCVDVARELGISRQRVSQIANLRYVCLIHTETALTNVSEIRADIWRPTGAEVVGDCARCKRELAYGKTEPQP